MARHLVSKCWDKWAHWLIVAVGRLIKADGNHLFGSHHQEDTRLPAPSTAEPHVGRMQFLLDLRLLGIMAANVLRAMDEVRREQFVMPHKVTSSYSDRAMPIACGQSISQPYIVAYMTEQLEVEPQHHVLEVGTGSGYQAAVLSRLVKKVTSIERYRTLARTARARLPWATTMWRS